MDPQLHSRLKRSAARLPVLLLASVLLVSGCSVKLAYNNLDRFARWAVSDYVDMTPVQRAYFDDALEEFLYWHRVEHLPRYAAFLEAVESTFADGTDEQEMQGMVNTVLSWADEIEARGLPIAVELLASLDDDQLAALPARLEAGNREIEEPERDLTLAQAQSAWAEEFSDRFRQFSGRLTKQQEAFVHSQSVRYLPERALWAEYRRRWQAQLLALLEQREDLPTFAAAFAQLNRERERYYGDELTGVFANNEALTRETSVWMVNNLSPRQQARFFTRLEELAQDLRELAGAVPPQVPAPDACLVTC
ncbi:MAG: DUF6279 family lipoprotein [Pseudomonadales bacterium]